jgi:hypothetical protein
VQSYWQQQGFKFSAIVDAGGFGAVYKVRKLLRRREVRLGISHFGVTQASVIAKRDDDER